MPSVTLSPLALLAQRHRTPRMLSANALRLWRREEHPTPSLRRIEKDDHLVRAGDVAPGEAPIRQHHHAGLGLSAAHLRPSDEPAAVRHLQPAGRNREAACVEDAPRRADAAHRLPAAAAGRAPANPAAAAAETAALTRLTYGLGDALAAADPARLLARSRTAAGGAPARAATDLAGDPALFAADGTAPQLALRDPAAAPAQRTRQRQRRPVAPPQPRLLSLAAAADARHLRVDPHVSDPPAAGASDRPVALTRHTPLLPPTVGALHPLARRADLRRALRTAAARLTNAAAPAGRARPRTDARRAGRHTRAAGAQAVEPQRLHRAGREDGRAALRRLRQNRLQPVRSPTQIPVRQGVPVRAERRGGRRRNRWERRAGKRRRLSRRGLSRNHLHDDIRHDDDLRRRTRDRRFLPPHQARRPRRHRQRTGQHHHQQPEHQQGKPVGRRRRRPRLSQPIPVVFFSHAAPPLLFRPMLRSFCRA